MGPLEATFGVEVLPVFGAVEILTKSPTIWWRARRAITLSEMRIAILSQSAEIYSTRRLIEAGNRAGHTMHLLDYIHARIQLTARGTRCFGYGSAPVPKLTAVIPRIAASATQAGIAIVGHFEAAGVYTCASSEGILLSRDKLRTLQVLAREGIAIPPTAFSHSGLESRALVQSVGGAPVVVKVLRGTQGVGVVLCDTVGAAESVIEAFRSLQATVLVQGLIKEAQGTDVRCIVVGGEVVATMLRRAPAGAFRSNLHRGGRAERVKLSDVERDVAIRSARAVGLDVAGVDILRGKKGPLVLEINSSPGLEGIEGITKLDVAGAIVRHVAQAAR